MILVDRDLIDAIVDGAVLEHRNEHKLHRDLLAASEGERTACAYQIEDRFRHHGISVPMERIEAYIAHRLRQAEWRVKFDTMLDELIELDTHDPLDNLFGDDLPE